MYHPVINHCYKFFFQKIVLFVTFENYMFYHFSYYLFYKLNATIEFIFHFYNYVQFICRFFIRKSYENKEAIYFWSLFKNLFLTLFWSAFICFLPCSSTDFVCFWKYFPNEKSLNLACSIICIWLEGNVSSPVGYSYLTIFPDDNADIFAASPLMSCYNFSSLILSSIVMIACYILCKRFFLKHKGWSVTRVVSITKKEYGFAVHFL